MAWQKIFWHQTFVLLLILILSFFSPCTQADPHTHADAPITKSEPLPPTSDPTLEDENLAPAPLKPEQLSKLNKNIEPYPYTGAITPRFGFLINAKELPDSEAFGYYFGLSYLFPKIYSPKWEVGIDLDNNSDARIYGARRQIFNEREAFRPFYSYGVTHRLVARERLASLTDLENYFFRASLGLEDLLDDPKSVRIEAEALFGISDFMVALTFAYSWGIHSK